MIRTHVSRATNGLLSCGVRCRQRRQPPVYNAGKPGTTPWKYITGDLPPPARTDTTGDHHLPARGSKLPPPTPKAHAQKHTPDRRPAHHGSNTLNIHSKTHTCTHTHTRGRTTRIASTQPQEKKTTPTPRCPQHPGSEHPLEPTGSDNGCHRKPRRTAKRGRTATQNRCTGAALHSPRCRGAHDEPPRIGAQLTWWPSLSWAPWQSAWPSSR